jgi:hypothetical protein
MKTLRLYGAGLLVALLLTLTACVPSTRGSGGGVVYPDFTLSLIPTITVQQGSSGTTILTITPRGGFTGRVELSLLSLEGALSGVSGSFTEIESDSRLVVRLTVSVDRGVAPGTYNLQVKATGGGITKTAPLRLKVTPLGTTWTLHSPGFNGLNGVTHGNGLFVAVGEGGTILTSRDGVSWTRRTSGGNTLLRVARGKGLFVAVGGGGTILTSSDGVTWMPQASGTSNWLFGVTYGNGTFVAVGDWGTILTSP